MLEKVGEISAFATVLALGLVLSRQRAARRIGFLTIAADQVLIRGWRSRRGIDVLILGAAILATSWSWTRHVDTLISRAPSAVGVAAVRDSFSDTRATERDRTTIARFRAALGSS